jgi:hypothetical protein
MGLSKGPGGPPAPGTLHRVANNLDEGDKMIDES